MTNQVGSLAIDGWVETTNTASRGLCGLSSYKKTVSGRMYYVTRQLSYRKEDRAMRPMYGCTEKF